MPASAHVLTANSGKSQPEHPAFGTVPDIVVTTTADAGEGSLREAILTANAANGTGKIVFMIDEPRPYVIRLESGLPEITAPVYIEGEPICADDQVISQMRVVIDGSDVPAGDGLYLTEEADHSIIHGLSIGGFIEGAGIFVDGAEGVMIACNHLGINSNGTEAIPNNTGIYSNNAPLISIGVGSPDGRNIVSGNIGYGIHIIGGGSVFDNYVGLDPAGNTSIPNGLSGIMVEGEGSFIVENVVSGNLEMGIFLDKASDVQVTQNTVGTTMDGVASIPNGLSGIYVRDSVNILIHERNIVSGNTEMGIMIRSSNAVTVQNNIIGTSMNGDFAVPNGFSGVGVSAGAFDITIGGELGVTGNLISGNAQLGIRISDDGTRDVTVIGNFIGTDIAGTYAIPNGLSGVYIRENANNNQIGSGIYNERNIISGNLQAGAVANFVYDNRIQGNFIGTDITGTYAIPNSFSGVSIEGGAVNTLIGGDFAGAGNLISGNAELGVYIADNGTSGTIITGNFIGVDISGMLSLSNGYSGVGVFDGATNTQVGGLLPSERNLISGNGQFGVAMSGEGSIGLTIINNLIGTDFNGELAISNGFGGVAIEAGARNAIIGGSQPEARNVISGNSYSGITVRDTGSGDVQISGNFIGSDITGQKDLGNSISGIRLSDDIDIITIGGEERGEGNLVAFNDADGIYIEGGTEITITGNAILSNGGAGVYFPNNDLGTTLGRNDFKRNCSNPDLSDCEDVVGEGQG